MFLVLCPCLCCRGFFLYVEVMKSFEDTLAEAFKFVDFSHFKLLIKDLVYIYELYDVDDEDNWLKDAVGEDDEINVRIIRTVYLLSRIAENHGSLLIAFKAKFPKLWERIERNNHI